jgi:hypothetical protein
MNGSSNSNLADRIIRRMNEEANRGEEENKYPDQWGIDDTGFPWPNPVNSQAVAAWLFFKWGKIDGVDNIYKIEDDIFISGKKVHQNRPTLLSFYNKPKIVVWANQSKDMQDENELWRQIKKIIFSEWPIVWVTIKEIAPEYSRDYIRITNDIVWGKDESDILIM